MSKTLIELFGDKELQEKIREARTVFHFEHPLQIMALDALANGIFLDGILKGINLGMITDPKERKEILAKLQEALETSDKTTLLAKKLFDEEENK